MDIDWSSAGITDVGTVRSINEDAYLASDERQLWAVADGMGGHSAGDFASQSIINTLEQIGLSTDFDDAVTQISFALGEVNDFLREQAVLRDAELIGSTVVVLIARGRKGCCLWAGDSRLYRMRDGLLSQVSEDHSRVQELIDAGRITKADASDHPESNIVTRALGVTESIEMARLDCDIQPGDTFLLCSDGLTSDLDDDDIGECLKGADCPSAVRLLLEQALKRGARDNVTAVVTRAFNDAVTQISPRIVAAEADDKTLISD